MIKRLGRLIQHKVWASSVAGQFLIDPAGLLSIVSSWNYTWYPKQQIDYIRPDKCTLPDFMWKHGEWALTNLDGTKEWSLLRPADNACPLYLNISYMLTWELSGNHCHRKILGNWLVIGCFGGKNRKSEDLITCLADFTFICDWWRSFALYFNYQGLYEVPCKFGDSCFDPALEQNKNT